MLRPALLFLAVAAAGRDCERVPPAELLASAPLPDAAPGRERFYETLEAYLTCGAASGGELGCEAIGRARVFSEPGNPARRCRRAAGFLRFQRRLAQGSPSAADCASWVSSLGMKLEPDAAGRLCRRREKAHRAGFDADFCWEFADEFRGAVELKPVGASPEVARQFCMELLYPVYGCDDAVFLRRSDCGQWAAAARASKTRAPADCGGRPLCLAALFDRPDECRRLADEAAELRCRALAP